jgi:hypothetical protein|tara:strand:+ start:3092 stop:3229 length:138 start_codon:yes stop_codon:yes gene_type:complete
MEPTIAIGLALFLLSEILPYTPLKGNGLAQLLIEALRSAFPHKGK